MWRTSSTVNIEYISAYSTQYDSACLYPTLMFTILNVWSNVSDIGDCSQRLSLEIHLHYNIFVLNQTFFFSGENICYAMFYKTQRLCVLDPCAKYTSTTWDFSHVHLYYMHNPDAKKWKTQQPCSTHGRRITLAHASSYVSFSPIYRRTVSKEFASQAPHKQDTALFLFVVYCIKKKTCLVHLWSQYNDAIYFLRAVLTA